MELEDLEFTLADQKDIDQIWSLMEGSIALRKEDGSTQWQDGYPNLTVLRSDIEKSWGYVLKSQDKIWAYLAAHIGQEPAYDKIDGAWISQDDFYVIHRITADRKGAGKGLGRKIIESLEHLAKKQNISSVRMDTNHDNYSMLRILEKMGYTFCGTVYHRGEARKAFEKKLF